jgi:hypothetical protein
MEPSGEIFVSHAARRYVRERIGGVSNRTRPRGGARGRGDLALSDEKKTKRGKTPLADEKAGTRSDKDIGHSLRSVYSSTVNEEIPPELLDLLGKLD